jgi:CRP-like cAMP-binding protein
MRSPTSSASRILSGLFASAIRLAGGVALEMVLRGLVGSTVALAPGGFWSTGESRFLKASLLASNWLMRLGDKLGYDCPLTQYHLADVLGLTAVHVNRVLRHLREDGLVTFQRGHVTFLDFGRLKVFSGFDIDYLDHEGPLLR